MKVMDTKKGLLSTKVKHSKYVQVINYFKDVGIDKFMSEITSSISQKDDPAIEQNINAYKVTAELLGADLITDVCQSLADNIKIPEKCNECLAALKEASEKTKSAISEYLHKVERI
jgi:hypothetical protein